MIKIDKYKTLLIKRYSIVTNNRTEEEESSKEKVVQSDLSNDSNYAAEKRRK